METLTANIVFGLPPKLSKGQEVAIDLELAELKDKQIHRPYGRFTSMQMSFDGENAYIITDEKKIQEALIRCQDADWIFHNLHFDIPHLRRWSNVQPTGKVYDTMLLEKVMFSGYYDSFSLADLSRRYLLVYLDKSERKKFKDLFTLDDDAANYAALDVIATWKVFQEQKIVAQANDFDLYEMVDYRAEKVIQKFGGMKMDVDGWIKLAEENEKSAEEIQNKYGKWAISFSKKTGKPLKNLVWDGIKLSSPLQVKKALEKFGIGGTDDESLSAISEESELARDVLKYRKHSKRASTYGKDYIANYVEADGRIYPSYNVCGAETSRMSSSSPNGQQLPHDKEYRDKFIAAEGSSLIIADYSAQEPRIMAQLSGDKALIEIMNSGKDIYMEVARMVFGEEITDKKDPRRNTMKVIVLGMPYGMSKVGVARKLELHEDEADRLIKSFFACFPELNLWMSRNKAKFVPNVITALGRRLWLNPFNSQWERNVCNAQIQGTAAEITKLALIEIDQVIGGKYIVNAVHDEVVLEVPDEVAEEYKRIVVDCMVSVAKKVHPLVNAKVDAAIAKNWSEKA